MAIATQADLANAMVGGQQIFFQKNPGTQQALTAGWGSILNTAGTPAPGTKAGTSTTAGVVPDATVAGFPAIQGFAAGNTGYLGQVLLTTTPVAANQNGQRFRLVDLLFKAGAYAFNASQALSAQPSYSARIPGGDYKGTEIWVETVTGFTGNPTVTVTYTNQDGVAGRSTSVTVTAPNNSQMTQFPLAAGDTGVQKIESVTGTVATAGTFNILVLRPLWMGHVQSFGDAGGAGDLVHGPDLTDLPVLFATSALFVQVSCCGTNAVGAFDAVFTIISG